jgi:hypothetical protein
MIDLILLLRVFRPEIAITLVEAAYKIITLQDVQLLLYDRE